jgi:hypothetical protein
MTWRPGLVEVEVGVGVSTEVYFITFVPQVYPILGAIIVVVVGAVESRR